MSIEPEPFLPKQYVVKKKSSGHSSHFRQSQREQQYKTPKKIEMFIDPSETLAELHKMKALRLRRASASSVNTKQLNRNTKRNYFMPKPIEVQEYAIIYVKLVKCFNQVCKTPVDNVVLKSRYAVFIAHIAVEMANILSHNLTIYETYDLSKVVTNFERKHKNKVITRNLAKLLKMLENIYINMDKLPNTFEDLDIITNKDILEKLKFIFENFKQLAESVTRFANRFYGNTDIFVISTELEADFTFVSSSEMTLQFKSFHRSVRRVVEFYEFLKTIEKVMDTETQSLSNNDLLYYLNRNDMTFINTTILSNIKEYDEKLVVNHRVSIPGYSHILGRPVRISEHIDILTHIEFQILEKM